MISELRQLVDEKLLYSHSRLNTNTSKTLKAAAFLHKLIETLDGRGFVKIKSLYKRKQDVGQRLAGQFRLNENDAELQN